MIVAVLDTNVLASGFIGETKLDSTPGELIRRWRAKTYTLAVSEVILDELAAAFATPYFASRLSTYETANALASLRTGTLLSPLSSNVVGVASHPEDDLILATVLSAQATHLVTGDKQLLARGAIRSAVILSPRQFLNVLRFGTQN